MGMAVEEFGFGFPPRAWSFTWRGTVYSLNWIPVGGFVRIKGESGAERHAADSFASKKTWQRFLVLIAGVTMNALTAAVILSISLMIGSPTEIDGGAPTHSSVSNLSIQIGEVLPKSPADMAGIQAGDRLVSIDGQTFSDEQSVRGYIQTHGDTGIDVEVKTTTGATLEAKLQAADLAGAPGVHGIGVGLIATGIVHVSFFWAIAYGFVGAAQLIWEVIAGLWSLLAQLIIQHQVSADVAGPVGIAVMTGDVAKLGFLYVLPFIAMLSANLAVVNLLPFPALDGGRIVFLILEKIRGKPSNERVETLVNNIGFILLLLLVLIITIHDFMHLGG